MAFSRITQNFAAERQQFKCGFCGKRNQYFEFHHVMSHFASKDDSVDNCVMLCYDCHREEAHVDGYTRGYVLDRSEYKYFNGGRRN